MKKTNPTAIGLLLSGCLALSYTITVNADTGGKHGKEQGQAKDKKHQKAHSTQSRYNRNRGKTTLRFDDQHRRLIEDYFARGSADRNCPPGLAKKGTACMPPGQVRQWQLNRPLPRDLERYPLPPDLLNRLPYAPPGYEYVRSANDILMITTGTNLVVDALRGLVR